MPGYTALQWLSPQWLWLLLALTVPVAIHLVRRSKPREITFAAAQWLLAKHQRRLNRLLLRDKWLLLLRLLLFILLALLLAQPLLQRGAPPTGDILLIDPRIERAAAEEFLTRHPQFTNPLWLQRHPAHFADSPPQATDLWSALSLLAGQGKFRRAHILLRDSTNPSGHDALRVSPHWQWHALHRNTLHRNTLHNDALAAPDGLPRIGIIGSPPPWLPAAIEQLGKSLGTDLAVQGLDENTLPAATEVDWLIYDGAGALPDGVRSFVERGGLLITDQRIQGENLPVFSRLESDPPLETLTLGRGSWLRYVDDWHSVAFFQRTDLPYQLWQQWRAQDWPLQHRTRGNWSLDSNPGIPVADTEVDNEENVPGTQALLLLLALLLLIERGAVLLRRPAAATESVHAGASADVH
ncbi:BatA domain-containing protein [uncultured Microbulbifer sp.]|uniref:BatA domain-containing protein n=1 Tax=uncultured Microbulbifer sp. TaxID=348147 RepID=UPI0025D65A79|nr:BatA domain-containing protein [uncultured Microbulbifer sp.]